MESFFSVVVFALVVLIIVSSMRREKAQTEKETPTGKINGTGKYKQEVVGESHYQEALTKAVKHAGGLTPCTTEALLILENSNQHDSNAVRVTINGMTVGYFPAEDAADYRNYLRESGVPIGNYRVSAKIFGGGEKFYGVWLDIVF